MEIIQLALEERIKTGRSHLAIIDFTDLNGTAGTGKTLSLAQYIARDILSRFCYDLVTPFDGGSTSGLVMDVGYNGASVDDDDAFIDAAELHLDSTEIIAGIGKPAAPATDTVDETYSTAESTVVNSLRTVINSLRAQLGLACLEAGAVEAVFTATGANLTDLTTGRVRVYFDLFRMPEMRGINNT